MQLRNNRCFCLARGVLLDNGVTSRDQIAQANTHSQRHMNNVWREMVTLTLALLCIAFFFLGLWDISTPTSHKPYGFIETLSILIPLTITILRLQAT